MNYKFCAVSSYRHINAELELTNFIKYYSPTVASWKLDIGRPFEISPTISVQFQPSTKFIPHSHKIVPSFDVEILVNDPLAVAQKEFANHIRDSLCIRLGNEFYRATSWSEN